MSLLYAAGGRPTAADVAQLLEAPEGAQAPAARISHQPDESEGWVEVLASGLTFDLTGLAPAQPIQSKPATQLFGLPANMQGAHFEVVSLTPGKHVASGTTMLPVIRVMCGLGARFAALGKVRAICWEPAQTWMEPAYFSRTALGWLSGGAFPALGLTGLAQTADGALESRGLTFFTGQELRVEALPTESDATTAKLAVRLIDLLVRQGRVQEPFDLEGPNGEPLSLVPDADGELIRVHRGR